MGILQTKGAVFTSGLEGWHFNVALDQEKNFDNLITYCADRYMKNLERVYIIPGKEVKKRTTITIYKSPSPSQHTWYEQHIVDVKPYNDAFHSLMEFLKDKEYLDIKDIKEWLKK